MRNWRRALGYYPLLPLGGATALVWANAAGDSYFRFAQSIAYPVNEIGVTFAIASLAQEVLEAMTPGGTLRSWRAAVLPIVAGVGGTVAAAATYATYIHATDEGILGRGWPIACGVDVFFSVALARALFRGGASVTFVVLVAIVSDVIALAFSSWRPFVDRAEPGAVGLIAIAVAVSIAFRALGVVSLWAYVLVAGPLSWFGCYWSGIHPAIALLPIVPFFRRSPRPLDDLDPLRHGHARYAHFETAFEYPLQGVAFLFGLVNAGVLMRGYGTGTWAILTASLAGRPLGILLTVSIALMIGLRPPRSMRWNDLVVIALLGSLGLTFAVFLSTAVFPDGPLLQETKIGAIATIVGAPIAFALARALRVGRFVQRTGRV